MENVPPNKRSILPLEFLILAGAGGLPLLKHVCRCGRRHLPNLLRVNKFPPLPWASWISWRAQDHHHLPGNLTGLAVEGKQLHDSTDLRTCSLDPQQRHYRGKQRKCEPLDPTPVLWN